MQLVNDSGELLRLSKYLKKKKEISDFGNSLEKKKKSFHEFLYSYIIEPSKNIRSRKFTRICTFLHISLRSPSLFFPFLSSPRQKRSIGVNTFFSCSRFDPSRVRVDYENFHNFLLFAQTLSSPVYTVNSTPLKTRGTGR